MRKSTMLWLTLAAFCGVALFHTSQKIHDSREKITVLAEATLREEESLRVLSTEWSYLNQPERLEKLAREYLSLAPMKGRQFAKVDDLPLRSAASVTTTAALLPEAPKPEVVSTAEIKPAAVVKPVIKAEKIQKPPVHTPFFASIALPKPLAPLPALKQPSAPATAANRSFSDVMKSLGAE